MINLTFGEQVKIVLSRKDMTIKELAEEIEARTGKKMSRQNLTQRLGRDNFQEQDMRMIAKILDCPFHLSIMTEAQIQPRSTAALEQERSPVQRRWRERQKRQVRQKQRMREKQRRRQKQRKRKKPQRSMERQSR